MKHKIQFNGIEVEVEQLPNGKFKKPEIAKKYDGFKYSIAPLKQVVETIMVFQKPYKTGSCLHDVLAYENGDNECTVGALDIDDNRVGVNGGTKKATQPKQESKTAYGNGINGNCGVESLNDGRFPSQAFVTTETAEILDKQSGVTTSSDRPRNNKGANETCFSGKGDCISFGFSDTGGASKILHKCDFETAEFDLFVYEPKVSASERNGGCDNLELKTSASADFRPNHTEKAENGENGNPYGRWKKLTNNHPTLKPIALNYQITKLFKTPNEQTVLVPFSGAGSELIGLFKAGFENIKGCELNPEFVEIAKARVKHHCEDLFNQNVLTN
jgi:hypothetical protein